MNGEEASPEPSPSGSPSPESSSSELSSAGPTARPPGPVRRLYDWVLHWADTPYGPLALFVLAVAEASVFPIPPDPLLLALCLGAPLRSFRLAGLATLGSVVGGVVGYLLGAGAWHLLDDFFFGYVPGVSPEAFTRVQSLYARYDFWAVFLAGLTPIPYKVFTLSAGVFSINFGIFLLASVLSRGLRFYVLGGLIRLFGPPIQRFVDRYFNHLTWIFGILLVLGFVVVRFLL